MNAALTHLHRALDAHIAMDAAVEVARTRLVLAEALASGAEHRSTLPEDARALLAEAHAGFVACGALLDLSQAERVAVAWKSHDAPLSRHDDGATDQGRRRR